MASSTSIDSVLDHNKWLHENTTLEPFRYLNHYNNRLKLLKRFVRCATKWINANVNEEEVISLGSLLARIEDCIHKYGQQVYCFRLGLEHKKRPRLVDCEDVVSKLGQDIWYFIYEIKEVYNTLSELPVCSQTIDEFMTFFDSVLENLKDLATGFGSEKYFKDLFEKVMFLKNFIGFAISRSVEGKSMEDLLTHVHAVAFNAMQISCNVSLSGKNATKSQVYELLQEINPVKPQVLEIYIQVFQTASSSKSSSSSSNTLTLELLGDQHMVIRDFIYSLQVYFWELLENYDTFSRESAINEQMLLHLYEGLSFLRIIFSSQEHREQLDEDLIGTIVSEAGTKIFSLFAKEVEESFYKEMNLLFANETEDSLNKEMNLALLDLIKKIKLIEAKLNLAATRFNFPRTNGLGFVNSLLRNLNELISTASVDLEKDEIRTVQAGLIFLRSFLEDTAEQRSKHKELQALWSSIVEVAYKVEFFMDSLTIGDDLNCSLVSLNAITEEINLLKTESSEIRDKKKYDFGAKTSSSHVPPRVPKGIMNQVVVGFDAEAKEIIGRLTRGSSKLDIVSIIGMPGLGKTTLAMKVYDDYSVVKYFHVRAWSCVSQKYHKKNLILDILEDIFEKIPDRFREMEEDDLVEKLYKSLKGRRYLILLDDVWDIAFWNDLERAFPDDSNGSRILLTSRHHNLALGNTKPHLLRSLTDSESWELLRKRLFLEEDCSPKLHALGLQIAKKCKGLPFSIVILAGILASTGKDKWTEFVEHICSDTICGTEQGTSMLELSYKHLPDYLKPCLLYFGVLNEDEEILSRWLKGIWIAEGFVQKSESKSVDEVAEDYMMDLINRNLVVVAKKSSRDGVKACRIHDLLHEFCLEKTREENFVKLLHGYEEIDMFHEPRGLRRLCIYSGGQQFTRSRLFCRHVHSLLFFMTYDDPCNYSLIFRIYKLLRVLDLGRIEFGDVFPSGIELLVQLRFLAISSSVHVIPSSVAKLQNLETFIVVGFNKIQLTEAIWNMKKLRHLYISHANLILPSDNLENSGLYNLDTFSTACLPPGPETEKVTHMLPNIRRLRCKLLESWDSTHNCNQVLKLDFLSRLESLSVSPDGGIQLPSDLGFSLPRNLKKLTLSGFRLPWTKISTIGKLPNLEVLKLIWNAFDGEIWEMEEGEFPELRFLELKDLDVVRWTTSDDHLLSRLEKIVLHDCWNLIELPSNLGNYPTLKMMEVHMCQECLASSLQQIQEEQEDMGNEGFKILTSLFQENEE